MRSHVATTGPSATLLGRDWYDDGAQDLVGRYTILESEAYARAVKDVSPSQFVALLEKTLGRALDDITLPVVVGTTMLEQRPELIVPLVPHLLRSAICPTRRWRRRPVTPGRSATSIPRIACCSPPPRAPRSPTAPGTGAGAGAPAAVVRARAPQANAAPRRPGLEATKAANGSPWRRWRSSNCDAAARPRRSTGARSQTSPGWRTSVPHLAALEGGTAPA